MKKLWSLAAATVVALTIGTVSGLPAQAETSSVPVPAQTTITGTVTLGGKAAASVSVQAFTQDYSVSGYAVTDAAGKYSLTLDKGAQVFVVAARGELNALTTYYGNTVREPDATVVTVATGATVAANIKMFAAGSLKGKLLTASGRALTNAWVTVTQVDGGGYGFATTDASGRFVLKGLASGKYTVSGSAASYAQPFTHGGAKAKVFAVRANRTTPVGTFKAPRIGKVTGIVKVTKTSGNGYVTLRPRAVQNGSPTSGPSKSGVVSIKGVAVGTYDVYVSGKGVVGKVVVRSGKTAKFRTVRLGKAAKITGYVRTFTKTRAAAVSVLVSDSKGNIVGDAVTNAKGRYTVDGLGAGTFTVTARSYEDPLPKRNAASKASTVKVKAGKVAKKTLLLRKEAVVTGYVKNAAGKPVVGIWITAGDAYAKTNINGRYTLRNVAPGKTTVLVNDWYEGGYRNASSKKTYTLRSGHLTKVATIKVKR